MPKINAAQKFSVQQQILRRSHAKLLAAAKLGASALDTLMGDSDIDDDDSPEFKACQALNKAVDYAEKKVR
ncbi:MAG: hypothetical protein ABL931_13745 [Usitatibacteraceae bacterium]